MLLNALVHSVCAIIGTISLRFEISACHNDGVVPELNLFYFGHA